MRPLKKLGVAETPTLVPLADMLTNTVGIMLFILAFTVLASGGALVAKRLPCEKETEADPIHFVCANQRILPLNLDLTDQFIDPLGKPTSENAESWVRDFNARKLSDEYFDLTGEGEVRHSSLFAFGRGVFDLSVYFHPKPGKGETKSQITNLVSTFSTILQTNRASGKYAFFFVYPDSIESFYAARSVVVERFQMQSGWTPMTAGKALGVSLTGSGGIKPRPQD
jgi:hypothetical protein